MALFDMRLNGVEHDFSYEAELQFRIDNLPNRMLGVWAAQKLDKAGVDLLHYTGDVVRSDIRHHGHEDVIRKVARDLGWRVNIKDVRVMRDACIEAAKVQITEGR